MADHGSSSKRAALTTNNTPATSSSVVQRPGASFSESMLWEAALRSVGGELVSTFWRLPELTAFPATNTACGPIQYQADVQLEQWEYLANFPNAMIDDQPAFDSPEFITDGELTSNGNLPSFGDVAGMYMRRALQTEKLSWTNNVVTESMLIPVVNVSSPFESNSRQLGGATLQGSVRNGFASNIHMADATLTPTMEALPAPLYCHQPIPENFISQMPAAAPTAASYGVVATQTRHDAASCNRQLLFPAPFHPAPTQQPPACQLRRRCTANRRATRFGPKASPENVDTVRSTNHPLVPHANVVAMPSIGSVGAFMRTPQLFLEFPQLPSHQAPVGSFTNVHDPPIHPPGHPATLLSSPTPTELADPSHYPKISKPRANRTQPRQKRTQTKTRARAPAPQPWQRTNAAIDHATAIWVEADHCKSAIQTHGKSAMQSHGKSAMQTHGTNSAIQTPGTNSAIQAHGKSAMQSDHGKSAIQTPGTNSAVQAHGKSAFWNSGAEQARFGRTSDPQHVQPCQSKFPPQFARPSTRGMTLETEVARKGKLTVTAQRPVATNSTVGPAMNTRGKQRVRREPAMDPQSVYARKSVQSKLADRIKAQEVYLKMCRRVRINERLQVLQQLIPNGTEAESLVTMLEEAFNYIKFLEHQLELLYSNDKWMLATPNVYKGKQIDNK